MTKYSLESRKDDYEPEEGEIQDDDDDDDDPMEEVPSKTAGSTTSHKGTDRETCSKTFLLCRRDESKSCSRKSNCNTYGGKPGVPDDAYISNHSSRARYRTSPAHKWYHTHRPSSSTAKEWGISKSSLGPKERERRESKRTRNQYYSSCVHLSCDQRFAPNITSGNSCLNTSIPPWHWYSKHVKEKNKKSPFSPSRNIATLCQSSSRNLSQTNISSFSLNSMLNVEKNIVAQKSEKITSKEKNYSHPGSPTSTNSIEIIEVPPKIPEVITIYDSDEEPCKDRNKNTSKNAASSPKEKNITRESQNDSSEIPQESSQLKNISQENSRSNNIQEHTVQRNGETEMQELNLQQDNNMQEIKLTTERSARSLMHIESGENGPCNQINKECASIMTDTHDNINQSMFGETISQAVLVETENKVSNRENDNDFWERNSEEDACFDTQSEISACQPTLNTNCETSYQGIQLPLLDTNVLLSSKCSAGYMIEDELSSVFKSIIKPQAQIYPANSEVLDNSKPDENFALLPRGDSPVPHSIYFPNLFQADEIVTSHSDIHSLQNTKCLCQKHISLSDYKSNAYIPQSVRINRNINYSVLKLIIPTNEKTNTINQHNSLDSEIIDKDEKNTLCKNDKEKNCSILNSHASDEGDLEKESPEDIEKDTSESMNNIIQTECSPISRNKMDNTKQNATLQSGCNTHSDTEITRNESIDDLLPHEITTISKNSENVENSVSGNNSENEKHLRKESTLTQSIETVQASSVAALKRRATELKKLHHSSVRKCENQKSILSVVRYKQLRDTASSLPSHHPPNISLHENDFKNANFSDKQVTSGSISGYSINSLGEKFLTYTSPLVYEDRIGTTDGENGLFNEQVTNRINVTVPELIINLGKESDSDDSDDKPSKSKSADSTHELKAEHKTSISISKTVNTEFEKKLEVLLKEARSQQESSIKFEKQGVVTSEELVTSVHSNRQNEIFTPVFTTFLHKNIQPSCAIQGCARAIPRSTVKRMASSKAGKPKTANHRIKSVVIKNFPETINQDRTIPNDRTMKHLNSASINSYKQANKGWSRSVGNKGKVSRQTSSTGMGDIGLLPPFKQKEYMKLKQQLVQMTQKKRDIRNKEVCESGGRNSKQEESRYMQTTEKITNKMNNCQEDLVTSENECITLLKVIDQKSLQTTSRRKPSEMEINVENHVSSESNSSYNHVQDVNVIDREQNDLPSHDPFPNTNVSEVITGSELITIGNFQEPSLNNNQDIVFQHQKELLPSLIKRQTSSIISNNNNPETRIHSEQSVLTGKRELTNSTQEQVQKKQRTENKEGEIPTSELQNINMKESASKTSGQCKLVENLWSSETKLIASRRQVLEDIATARIQLYKIEAANCRKDLLIKNINQLKDELKQSEEKLKQEEDCIKNLNNMIDHSRLIIQRGQSELLSLTLECEELGCKVHGPPNYNVPKTCADLIRNEMLAMTQAMQELENNKIAM